MPDTINSFKVDSCYVVKPLTIDDLDRAIDIWSIAFGFMDRVRWRKFFESCLDERFGVYVDDYLVAIAGITHFQIWLGDKQAPCGGISAVACDPPHRRRGLVRKLLKACLQSLHDKRVPVSTLWPFSYPFYARMGYSVCDFRYEVTANCSVLPDIGDSSTYRKIDTNNFEALRGIHSSWIELSNLSHSRSSHQWTRLLNNPQRELSIFKSSNGYMILNSKVKTPRVLEVLEWAYLNKEDFLSGLSLLRRLDDLSFDKVQWITPNPEELLAFGITDPQIELSYKPGIMARVVHTQSFVEHLGVDIDSFKLEDPLLVSDSYGNGENGNRDPEVISPGRLVQLVSGILTDDDRNKAFNFTGLLSDKKPFCIEFF